LLYMAGEGYNDADTDGDTAPNSPTFPPAKLVPLPVLHRASRVMIEEEEEENKSHWTTTQDYTIEILMTQLNPTACVPFFTPDTVDPFNNNADDPNAISPSDHAQLVSRQIGISDLFPRHLTTLDAYAFTPCGYSSNALLKWGGSDDGDTDGEIGCGAKTAQGEGYYTIHVTPEEGFSYASFECNVPLSPKPSPLGSSNEVETKSTIPDLRTLIRRVVKIFQPGKLTLTLFVSAEDDDEDGAGGDQESAVEAAQRAFKSALTRPGEQGLLYDRTDKINYEFGGYELAFASFEVR